MVIFERNPFFGSDIQFKESEYFLEPNLIILPDPEPEPDPESISVPDSIADFSVETQYENCSQADFATILIDWIYDFCSNAHQCLLRHWPFWLLMLIGLYFIRRQKKRDRLSLGLLSAELERRSQNKTDEIVHLDVDGTKYEKSKDKSQDVEKSSSNANEKLEYENKQFGLIIV